MIGGMIPSAVFSFGALQSRCPSMESSAIDCRFQTQFNSRETNSKNLMLKISDSAQKIKIFTETKASIKSTSTNEFIDRNSRNRRSERMFNKSAPFPGFKYDEQNAENRFMYMKRKKSAPASNIDQSSKQEIRIQNEIQVSNTRTVQILQTEWNTIYLKLIIAVAAMESIKGVDRERNHRNPNMKMQISVRSLCLPAFCFFTSAP